MSIDVLQAKIRKLKNPTLLSLEPTPALLPPQLLADCVEKHGPTLAALAEGYRLLCKGVLDALKGVVPAVRVRQACFLALGAEGLAVMQKLMAHARRLGYYVLLDAARSETETIAALEAESLFSGVRVGEETLCPYACDGVTLSAYLGSDGIKPYLPWLKGEHPKNIFVVVHTANRSAREVQNLISGDRTVHTAIADMSLRWSLDLFGKNGYGEVGIVASATDAETLRELRRKYDQLFFVVPGWGAPNVAMRNLRHAFDGIGHGAIIADEGVILGAWRTAEDGQDWTAAAVAAAEKLRDAILSCVRVY